MDFHDRYKSSWDREKLILLMNKHLLISFRQIKLNILFFELKEPDCWQSKTRSNAKL